MNVYDLPKIWSDTIGSGHLSAVVSIFIVEQRDYGDTFGARLKFIDPDLNPPNDDAWIVHDYIYISRTITVEQIIEQAMKAAREFHSFILKLISNYGNNKTLDTWAMKCELLITKQKDTLIRAQRAESALAEKTKRVEQLEDDYVKKLEEEIIKLKEQLDTMINTMQDHVVYWKYWRDNH